MLTVNNDEFWEGVSPLEFGELPALQDAVTVVGYPIGGDTISVTSGVVSRIEILSYVHGSTELLGLQVYMITLLAFLLSKIANLLKVFVCYLFFTILLQIDAAINSGNSGGPAFNDKGNCVGIAFQSLKHEDVENIGYVIPTPVIQHFIQDYEKNEAYTGNLVCLLNNTFYQHTVQFFYCDESALLHLSSRLKSHDLSYYARISNFGG